VLEPDYPAVDTAVVAEGADESRQSLQQLVAVLLLDVSNCCGELAGEEFLLAVGTVLEDVSAAVHFQVVVVVLHVDDAQVAEVQVHLHQPVAVAPEVLTQAACREVLVVYVGQWIL
jgi:hypothetical protein